MTTPERLDLTPPPRFDAFRERRTRGQRHRARMGVVYTAIVRVRRLVGRG